MKIVLLLLVVVSCNTRLSHGDSAMDKIDKSIAAGNKIMHALADHKEEDFESAMFTIAGKVNEYLEGYFPSLKLLEIFLPDADGTSKMIEEGFAKMDAKFDLVFNRIDDLEDETLRTSLKAQYGEYARRITLMSERLDEYLQSADPNGTSKEKFLHDYDEHFDDNVRQLFDAMMKPESGVLMDGIPEIIKEVTNQNRKDFQLIVKRILHVIIQGVATELAYYGIVEDKASYNTTKQEWEQRISMLIDHIIEIDEDMRYNYMAQVKKDTAILLAKMQGRSNKDFADILYEFLSDKYDWREWVVVVFNDIPSNTYKLKLAGNAFQINLHGRNVIVTSSSKYRQPDIGHVKRTLEKIPSGYSYEETGWLGQPEGWHWKFYNEQDLLNKASKSNLDSDYTLGVIRKQYRPDLVVRGPEDRYALITKQNLDMEHSDNYLIGEVRFWMFAIYTEEACEGNEDPHEPCGDDSSLIGGDFFLLANVYDSVEKLILKLQNVTKT